MDRDAYIIFIAALVAGALGLVSSILIVFLAPDNEQGFNPPVERFMEERFR